MADVDVQDSDDHSDPVSVSESSNCGLVLYVCSGLSPCRAVMMCCKALDLQVKFVEVDLFQKEHMTPQFLKMNPQHSVPTMDDDGFYLWESRAILTYLSDKYANASDQFLYPKDAQRRALVNKMLYFDLLPLYYAISNLVLPQVFDGVLSNPAAESSVEVALQYLEAIFGDNDTFVAGHHLTIADFAILASVTCLEIISYPLQKYSKIFSWVEKMKENIPYYEDCSKTLYTWKQLMITKRSQMERF